VELTVIVVGAGHSGPKNSGLICWIIPPHPDELAIVGFEVMKVRDLQGGVIGTLVSQDVISADEDHEREKRGSGFGRRTCLGSPWAVHWPWKQINSRAASSNNGSRIHNSERTRVRTWR